MMSQEVSREGFITWLRKQPPETPYCYMSISDCMMCRYYRAMGYPVTTVSATYWRDKGDVPHEFPPDLRDREFQQELARWSRYGDLLQHLEGRTSE